MLFYVQMKWNYQGRISQEQLWDIEALEGEHGLAGVQSGLVKGLYKVASQHRVIAIVDAASAEDLDRNSMGWLPMREYLEFEQVWALRDYAGFVEDVKNRFPLSPPAVAPPVLSTRQVVEKWFSLLDQKKFDEGLTLVDDDVTWDNIPATPGVSDIAPWLGSYKGLAAVKESFVVFTDHSRVDFMRLRDLVVEGEKAVALFHEHGMCWANNNEYDLHVSNHMRVVGGKIRQWSAYWDISPLVRAYKNL